MSHFESIKESLLQKKKLFEDVDFPANYDSLGTIGVRDPVVWKRPKVRINGMIRINVNIQLHKLLQI